MEVGVESHRGLQEAAADAVDDEGGTGMRRCALVFFDDPINLMQHISA